MHNWVFISLWLDAWVDCKFQTQKCLLHQNLRPSSWQNTMKPSEKKTSRRSLNESLRDNPRRDYNANNIKIVIYGDHVRNRFTCLEELLGVINPLLIRENVLAEHLNTVCVSGEFFHWFTARCHYLLTIKWLSLLHLSRIVVNCYKLSLAADSKVCVNCQSSIEEAKIEMTEMYCPNMEKESHKN